MTGPEHYTAAEEAIREADKALKNGHDPAAVDYAEMMLRKAGVHATLALAAATALAKTGQGRGVDMTAWEAAASLWKNG